MNNKFKINSPTCQQKALDKGLLSRIALHRKKKKHFNNTSEQSIKETLTKLDKTSPKATEIMNELLKYSNSVKLIYPSQSTIAKKVGVCRQYVNKVAGKLEESGLIYKHYIHRRPSSYYLHPLFYDLRFRKKINHILKALCWTLLPLSLLASEVQAYYKHRQKVYEIARNSEATPPKKFLTELFKDNTRYLDKYSKYTYKSKRKSECGNNVENFRPKYGFNLDKWLKRQKRDRDNLDINKLKTRTEKNMIELKQKLTKLLGLTDAGWLYLECFGKKVLSRAYVRMVQQSKVSNPYTYFKGICNTICKNENIKINWREYFQKLEAQGIAKDAPKTNLSTAQSLLSLPGNKRTKKDNCETCCIRLTKNPANIAQWRSLKEKGYFIGECSCDRETVPYRMDESGRMHKAEEKQFDDLYRSLKIKFALKDKTHEDIDLDDIDKITQQNIPKPLKGPGETYTISEIACELALLNDSKATKNFSTLFGEEYCFGYKQRIILNYLTYNINYGNSKEDRTALLYVAELVKKYDIPQELIPQQLLNCSERKDSPETEYESFLREEHEKEIVGRNLFGDLADDKEVFSRL